MICPSSRLSSPNVLKLLCLLAIIPVGYFYGASRLQSEMPNHEFVRRSKNELKFANSFHKWMFENLDYSRGFAESQKHRMVEFAFDDQQLKNRFEKEFWPTHMRTSSNGVFASPLYTEVDRKSNNIWKVASRVKFISTEAEFPTVNSSIVFEIDHSCKPPKITDYKFEYGHTELLELWADSKNHNLSIHSVQALFYFKNAVNYIFQSQHQLAVEELSRAIEIEPSFRNAIILKAQAAGYLRAEKAYPIICEALEKYPTMTSLYLVRSGVKLDLSDYEGALLDLESASKSNQSNWGLLINRAYCLSQLGRHKEALADLDKAISLRPDDKSTFCYRGFAKEASGDRIGAYFDFAEAKSQVPFLRFDAQNHPSLCPYITFAQ
ncbi:MAG: tetratricopeptide repeat protein [Cyanobacteria bacterium TGS_CYA1]|nr:tetratricopeptide repeat protein [Cyanobacteria bacterium TGS_CYA1]